MSDLIPTSAIIASLAAGSDPAVDWACRGFDADFAAELQAWKRLRLLFRRLGRHRLQSRHWSEPIE